MTALTPWRMTSTVLFGQVHISGDTADRITKPFAVKFNETLGTSDRIPEILVTVSGFRQHIGDPGQSACFLTAQNVTNEGFEIYATTKMESEKSYLAEVDATWIAFLR
ncbi:H-type lectin domain-containing protein [Aminobacter anthyllidis]|uniref:H-type lectin domain-containing protein n=1 Tax=Aminobacter anthyllidis TaxID=1035067 RepID=UPI002458F0DC|nr:H-type lectin domain-containing protein [Aminobacter anthyllidis]MDH4986645.1 H-type lectin domain-containing protein [Aminobacter anthyllidis]